MKSNLYIPATITVGFQKRTDTFTGMLGYVIYTDHKGVLRKEGSWNSWRTHSIDPVTFNNDAQTGFCLNKGVQRDNYWGNGRSVIRVHDPRNFEFEISVDNLIGILMHADVSKRDITEPCVFAWYGTELILLPTNSKEYQESVVHTNNQHITFSSKSLVAGHSYVPRKWRNSVVYLGFFHRWGSTRDDRSNYINSVNIKQIKKPSKSHVFMDPSTKAVFCWNPSTHIAKVDVEECHPKFGALLEHYYTTDGSQPWIGGTVGPATNIYNREQVWARISNTEFACYYIQYNGYGNPVKVSVYMLARWNPEFPGFELSRTSSSYVYSRTNLGNPHLPGFYVTNSAVVATLAIIKHVILEVLPETTPSTPPPTANAKQQIIEKLWRNHQIGGNLYAVQENGTTVNII